MINNDNNNDDNDEEQKSYIIIAPQMPSDQHNNSYEVVDREEIKAAYTERHNELNIVPYDSAQHPSVNSNPMRIACSGGGGHIAAMNALLDLYPPDSLTYYHPVGYTQKKSNLTSLSIFTASHASSYLQTATQYLHLPTMPLNTELSQAITLLDNKKPKPFIDMLLDVYDAGYESAALWNIFQQKDQTQELTQLVALQTHNDKLNYQTVYDYFFTLLNKAYEEERPYTHVISTQAIGLPALCDAIKNYNQTYNEALRIHQYITDLPTTGACHYFGVLSQLSADQQKQIILYAVNITPVIIDYFFKKGAFFNTIYTIDPKHNPMVRSGFYNATLNNSTEFESHVTLLLNNTRAITILPNELIASIMLGSQASTATISYVRDLIDNGIKKVFVFGGNNVQISQKITQLIEDAQDYTDKIIVLGHQDDTAMTALMTRCNLLIIRGGGISIMEQLVMTHNQKQIILIHHKDPDTTDLKTPSSTQEESSNLETIDKMTSGISWEDENANYCIETLSREGIQIEKTCPKMAYQQIQRLMTKNGYSFLTQDTTEDRSWLKIQTP
jgi:hypothetical protein